MTYTAGEDLAKILWLKSENSESWLQRRATYTRSLAVMSMVGYILGLGDRHPSNLMLDRKTGKIIHIDFGDCFEVAKHRDKFPEKVPFRLTRMLVNAMEVAGIEGNYRLTCEKVMTVLRENRDSLVATLEAFLHDPLISWRLMNINPKKVVRTEVLPKEASQQHQPQQTKASAAATTSETVSTQLPAQLQPQISLTETQKPFSVTSSSASSASTSSQGAVARSMVAKSFLATLEPIHEKKSSSTPSSTAASSSDKVSTSKGKSDTTTEEEEEEEEEDVAVMQRYNPRRSDSKDVLQPTILLESGGVGTGIETIMSGSGGEGTGSSGISLQMNPLIQPIGFAEHSAVNDIISTSYRKQNLLKQNDSNPMLDLVNAATNPTGSVTSGGGSGGIGGQGDRDRESGSTKDNRSNNNPKSVSFSQLNQTIDADNTIRKSSTSVAIVKQDPEEEANKIASSHQPAQQQPQQQQQPSGMFSPSNNSETNEEPEGSNMLPSNNSSNNLQFAPTLNVAIAIPSNMNTPGIISSSLRNTGTSIYNTNIHNEISNLANSISQHNPTRMLAASARQNQMIGSSVRSLIYAPSGGGGGGEGENKGADGGVGGNNDTELTDKAVIVIKRVTDKLTGLDFPCENVHHSPSSPQQTPLMNQQGSSSSSSSSSVHLQQCLQQPQALEVSEQVDRLIREAISNENLSQSFFGWCPFW
jgi:hypothetical protein